MNSDTINVAFLGAGDISHLHAEAVAETAGANFCGVWNRTPAKAEALAASHNSRVYATVDDVFNDDTVDVVYVLTNMETHVDFALRAIKANKHVLVEKPVGCSVEEIEQLRVAADSASVHCAPVHNYIYEPGLERTKELLDTGKLGRLVAFYMMYNIHHPEAVCARYPGVIRQILTHHAYTMIYLAGNPVSLSCMKSTVNDGTVEQENLAMVNCRLESGALAHLCASFAADDHAGDPWTCMIKVIGQNGATRFSYRDWVENKPGIVHSHTFSTYPYSIKNVTTHFLNKTIRQGVPPLSSIADAVTSQKIVEAAEASALGEHQQV